MSVKFRVNRESPHGMVHLLSEEELSSIDMPSSPQKSIEEEEVEEKPPPSPLMMQNHTQRKLLPRHLTMIAIGGTIGTGLFLGSGAALATAGPLGALLGYLIMGSVMWSVTTTLGEMSAFLPVAGSFTNYAGRFVDPALGFATGWNYWYSYAITLPTEITAAAIVISYWKIDVPVAVWILIFLFATVAINMIGAGAYGETEFWLSIFKVLTIIGLIVCGFILVLGGGPDREVIGFKYWREPGAFNYMYSETPGGYFLATWAVFIQAAFSYQGTEIVAVTAAEAKNPRKTIPSALRSVFIRILLFYVLGVMVIGLLVPFNDPELLQLNEEDSGTADSSPFVIFIRRAGISGLPSIINAVILTAAFSAGNSDLYAASRTLYALALERRAPAIFAKCTDGGLPLYAVLATSTIGLLALLNVNAAGGSVFMWLLSFASVSGLITWATICLCYIRFYGALKVQGIDRSVLPYRAPFQPYSAWFGMISCIIIIVFNGFASLFPFHFVGFVSAYVGVPLFFAVYWGYKKYYHTRMVELNQVTFEMPHGTIEQEEEEELLPPPHNYWEKIQREPNAFKRTNDLAGFRMQRSTGSEGCHKQKTSIVVVSELKLQQLAMSGLDYRPCEAHSEEAFRSPFLVKECRLSFHFGFNFGVSKFLCRWRKKASAIDLAIPIVKVIQVQFATANGNVDKPPRQPQQRYDMMNDSRRPFPVDNTIKKRKKAGSFIQTNPTLRSLLSLKTSTPLEGLFTGWTERQKYEALRQLIDSAELSTEHQFQLLLQIDGNLKTNPMDVIPPELGLYVFSFLDRRDLSRAALVCRQWKELAYDRTLLIQKVKDGYMYCGTCSTLIGCEEDVLSRKYRLDFSLAFHVKILHNVDIGPLERVDFSNGTCFHVAAASCRKCKTELGVRYMPRPEEEQSSTDEDEEDETSHHVGAHHEIYDSLSSVSHGPVLDSTVGTFLLKKKMAYFPGEALVSTVTVCSSCGNHVGKEHNIISWNYCLRGSEAFQFSSLQNVSFGEPKRVSYSSGNYTVSDASCVGCHELIGIKYLQASDGQNAYKVGTFLVEKPKVKVISVTMQAASRDKRKNRRSSLLSLFSFLRKPAVASQ
ncbi:AAT family amino acid transporter [Planoprotostelium fungivorum]|uniref:AAT family amino acid transporter n=1 Tax=Planoprotostelium fungivorum TaxID=1890364 RepID=A0A2P6N9X5_9EUKA|nr:AAT family amino acid transporter [Planoprotostelium fungivorum]